VPSLGLLFVVAMIVQPRLSSDLAFVIPSLVVLVLLAAPPLLSGAYAGVAAVDPAARDAAYGMGLPGARVLRDVELPCALPLVLSGLRGATMQVIATATIAAAVSLGGLGRYLVDGLALQDYPQMAGGAVLVAALALAVDGGLALITRSAVSPGLSGKDPGAARVAGPKGRLLAPGPRPVSPTDGSELT
jgi:osmoprotectant transport system permease protein